VDKAFLRAQAFLTKTQRQRNVARHGRHDAWRRWHEAKGEGRPVTDAENAFKKLRKYPGDKQATVALERALKQLKEREKPVQENSQRKEW
jgi:hypothetical protein